MENPILTIEEVARYLKISVRSVYKLARQGRIPSSKVLNKWRFDRREIDNLLKSGEFNQYHNTNRRLHEER